MNSASNCSVGLTPLTGLCSGHGVCLSTAQCVCFSGFSGWGDFVQLPETDCHIHEVSALVAWFILLVYTVLFFLYTSHLFFVYMRDFWPAFDGSAEHLWAFIKLPPISMVCLNWLTLLCWSSMALGKIITWSRDDWRLTTDVQAVAHHVPATIFYSAGGILFWSLAGLQLKNLVRSALQIRAGQIGVAVCTALLQHFTWGLHGNQTINALSFILLFIPIAPSLAHLQAPMIIAHFAFKMLTVVLLGFSIHYQAKPLVYELKQHLENQAKALAKSLATTPVSFTPTTPRESFAAVVPSTPSPTSHSLTPTSQEDTNTDPPNRPFTATTAASSTFSDTQSSFASSSASSSTTSTFTSSSSATSIASSDSSSSSDSSTSSTPPPAQLASLLTSASAPTLPVLSDKTVELPGVVDDQEGHPFDSVPDVPDKTRQVSFAVDVRHASVNQKRPQEGNSTALTSASSPSFIIQVVAPSSSQTPSPSPSPSDYFTVVNSASPASISPSLPGSTPTSFDSTSTEAAEQTNSKSPHPSLPALRHKLPVPGNNNSNSSSISPSSSSSSSPSSSDSHPKSNSLSSTPSPTPSPNSSPRPSTSLGDSFSSAAQTRQSAAERKRAEQQAICDALEELIRRTMLTVFSQLALFLCFAAWPFLRAYGIYLLPLMLCAAMGPMRQVMSVLPPQVTPPQSRLGTLGTGGGGGGSMLSVTR